MARYQIITVVDITRTNPVRDETDRVKLGQQANFNSLVQAIGMRSNVTWLRDPELHDGRLPIGPGKATHWIWQFDAEREDVFLAQGDPVALLVDDLDGVPIVDQLNNTVELTPAVFRSRGDNTNIWVTKISP
jgi:hypothetical protein